MRLFSGLSLIVLAVLSSVTCQASEPAVPSMLSYQGFTGILNTPTAHVNDEGSIHLIYSDQHENIWRGQKNDRQGNFLMSVGLFSFFELGGRLTEVPKADGSIGTRDLSASFKVTSAPLTKDRAYWPVVAAGIQDVGGGANLLESRYIVVSEDLWRFRLSAGYGFKSERMKGGFAGAEIKLHDWVTLLGEYDTHDTSAGIRIVSPEIWKTPLQVATTFKSTLNHRPGNIDFALGLTFPLDFRKRALQASPSAETVPEPIPKQMIEASTVKTPSIGLTPTLKSTTSHSSSAATPDTTNIVSSQASSQLDSLKIQLVKAGFINVRVGQRLSRELVVEYENSIYNHNELDALGVVAGLVSQSAAEQYETVRFVIKRKGLRVALVSVPCNTLRSFMKQAGSVTALREALTFSYNTDSVDDAYFQPDNGGFVFPETSLILAPGLQTFVGTDFGVFDYVLSLKPEILSNLWKGGVFQARWDLPLMWSSNFDDGQPYRGRRSAPRMDRGMLFQGVNLAPGLMANLGAGLVLHDIYGTWNEMIWSPSEGTHRFRGMQGWARNKETRQNLDVYLGSYRYYHAPLDLTLEATGGKFWGQDRGFSLEMKRFFGDTAVSTYYKNSKTAEGKRWQVAGIQFGFPLTFGKDYKAGSVVVRGANEWGYAQETTLAIGGQKTNDVLSQSLGINPQPNPALYNAYYNRDRLSAGYISQHLERLRDAWVRYGQIKPDLH
jgi:hypothetical protein